MTNRVFSTIDKMPLAGKFVTHDVVMNYVVSNEEKERKRHLIAVGVLGVFAIGHAYQSYLGINGIIQNANYAEHTGGGMNVGLSAIEAAYAGVNAAITLREIDLLKRVETIRSKKRHKHSKQAVEHNTEDGIDRESRTSMGNYGMKSVGVATLFTVAAQGLALESFQLSEQDNEKVICVEQVSDDLRSYDSDQYSYDDKAQIIELNCHVDDLATRIPSL